MSEVKWIKLVTEFFDDEKIKLIEAMPEADMVLVIWIKLLTLAGKKNMNGYIFLTKNIPYTDEMLATIFNRPVNTVRLALDVFKKFKMIDYDNEMLQISNWGKHQNTEGLARIKEQNNKRATEYRKRLTAVGGYNYLEHYNFIHQRDKGECVYCGSKENLCIDHLVSLINGGDNGVDNLVLSCKACNSGKSGKFVEDSYNEFYNKKTAEQYEEVKKRLKITHNVTLNHAPRLDKNRLEEDKIRLDKSINNIYSIWNDQNIKKHKSIEPFKSAIKIALDKYSEEDIISAINNYAYILKGKDYFYSYKFILSKFLTITAKTNHIEEFKNLEIAKNNYKKGGKNNGKNKGYNKPDTSGSKGSEIDKYKRLEETYEV